MYLIDDGNGSAVAVEARIRDRLAVQLHADRIDAELARGASPDATVSSALRSRALTSDQSRRILARGLRRALKRAKETSTATSAVPVNRAGVISAEREIMQLQHVLLSAGPVSVRGVAQVRMLLITGTGPLYSRGAGITLRADLRAAIDALNILGTARA
ncbi:MAG: hypothetical protein M3Y44_04960 [Actinomycetota bacterium]|nr:hypothetical protein [Actinomycetota bacterium]